MKSNGEISVEVIKHLKSLKLKPGENVAIGMGIAAHFCVDAMTNPEIDKEFCVATFSDAIDIIVQQRIKLLAEAE